MFDIGKRIIELRNLNDLSANKLSKILDVDPSTISKIENGSALPSLQLLFNICEYFKISLSDFFNDSDDLSPDLIQLLNNAKKLTPEQLDKLNDFIKTL